MNRPPNSRTSESGFTDFIQYEEDGTEETDQSPHPAMKTGRRSSSGPPQAAKPLDKPVMQCCLENFQQFLSRLITLHITPGQGDRGAMQLEPLVAKDCQRGENSIQRECVAAFTAACQLFLECSSFPVYIAEGNLKSSPSHEEQCGTCLTLTKISLCFCCECLNVLYILGQKPYTFYQSIS